jgi:hypothetical protein
MGAGVSTDLFSGRRGSAMIYRNVDRSRYIGLDPQDSVSLANTYPRPARFPGKQKVVALQPTCNATHPRDLVFVDFAAHFGSQSVSDISVYNEGYETLMINTTRVCETTVPAECIRQYSRDQCLAQLTTKHLEELEQGARGGHSNPAAVAGIVVGSAAGLAVIVGGLMAWAAAKRRRRQQGEEAAASKAPQEPLPGSFGAGFRSG